MLSRIHIRGVIKPFGISHRLLVNAQTTLAPESKQAWLFIDSVFPIRFARWDPRAYIVSFQRDTLLSKLREILASCVPKDVKLLSLDSRMKDGGVFARIEYPWQAMPEERESPLTKIVDHIRSEALKRGGLPSWFGNLKKVEVWEVQGKPWFEDLNRFASPVLKVEFEGPDVHMEDLWRLFRPYGKIQNISNPTPVPAGSLRSSTVTFSNLNSAAIARNCIHGERLTGIDGKITRLATTFEPPIKAHYFRDWISSHPRIVLPVLVFLLGTLTYTIFDPLRILAVEGKMLHWFNWQEYTVVQWLRRNTLDLIPLRWKEIKTSSSTLWKDREDSVGAIRTYLHDLPETATFIYGPSGSGKVSTLCEIVDESHRRVLLIDCDELCQGGSDHSLLRSLAMQTGYWPYFSFLDSVNNMLDLASTSIIGKPAGFSTSTSSQVDEMLKVVTSALERVRAKGEQRASSRREKREQCNAELKSGSEHDGRLDCVAGIGIISELGLGDEPSDQEGPPWPTFPLAKKLKQPSHRIAQSAVDALPIVIVKNFASKNSRDKDNILDALAKWVARLVDLKIAHVFVVSDNRESARRLAKSISSSPLNYIPFSDADSKSALTFVTSRIADAMGQEPMLSCNEIDLIGRLGGRASDLRTLVHKIQNGESVTVAVEDIINRGVAEIRKTVFGDDSEESKSLLWSQSQAWTIVKQLAAKDEIPYHKTLSESFKGEESALRAMEKAELVNLSMQDGRRTAIRVGKPVYKWVFKQLVKDEVFNAVQEIIVKEKSLSSSQATIVGCEEELAKLNDIRDLESRWNPLAPAGISRRIEYLLNKLEEAEKTRGRLEKDIANLKVILDKDATSKLHFRRK